jgi:hypothetical protein
MWCICKSRNDNLFNRKKGETVSNQYNLELSALRNKHMQENPARLSKILNIDRPTFLTDNQNSVQQAKESITLFCNGILGIYWLASLRFSPAIQHRFFSLKEI